jgi:hypothetical protein
MSRPLTDLPITTFAYAARTGSASAAEAGGVVARPATTASPRIGVSA